MRANEQSKIRAALIAATPVALTGALGNLATIPNIPIWYASLIRPPLTPPNWLFGPVWTLLYLLMAIAFYRVLRLEPATPGRGRNEEQTCRGLTNGSTSSSASGDRG